MYLDIEVAFVMNFDVTSELAKCERVEITKQIRGYIFRGFIEKQKRKKNGK